MIGGSRPKTVDRKVADALVRGTEAFLLQGIVGARNFRLMFLPPGAEFDAASLIAKTRAESASLLLARFNHLDGFGDEVELLVTCVFALDGRFAQHDCLPWIGSYDDQITFIPVETNMKATFKVGPNGRFVSTGRRPPNKAVLRGCRRAFELMMGYVLDKGG